MKATVCHINTHIRASEYTCPQSAPHTEKEENYIWDWWTMKKWECGKGNSDVPRATS